MNQGEKKDLHARFFNTAEYDLYDPYSHEFIGYGLQSMAYQEMMPDAEQAEQLLESYRQRFGSLE